MRRDTPVMAVCWVGMALVLIMKVLKSHMLITKDHARCHHRPRTPSLTSSTRTSSPTVTDLRGEALRARTCGPRCARPIGQGLPSSRRHYLNVPRPIRRRVLGGCSSRIFTASMAFTVITAARLPLLPPSRAGPLTTLQASLHAADRPVAPPKGLSTLGFDPDRFQPEPPVCYRAS